MNFKAGDRALAKSLAHIFTIDATSPVSWALRASPFLRAGWYSYWVGQLFTTRRNIFKSFITSYIYLLIRVNKEKENKKEREKIFLNYFIWGYRFYALG